MIDKFIFAEPEYVECIDAMIPDQCKQQPSWQLAIGFYKIELSLGEIDFFSYVLISLIQF